ncbi:MAG: leucyl-tRNA synthetase, leucyl-tRNA synthetase [Candidatus Saccharibacteria bacterium]|nr:leucyl-tRNA synthetase, leucyl-tRNA synthetase [Candidatus Saccharibacteria bacterium]
MNRYNPNEIEPKWQAYWDEHQTYHANLNSDKPKYLAMSMFNYPSGAGIHIGHAMNYTISDVKARFKRQAGYESYHPVGWDAFGLPAENFAIKSGISPQASMAKIIPDYHKQYKAMGWSNDWQREIATHEPQYYKWTQWIFSQMYKHGLAYQDSRLQWWCEKDNTVLANEQIIDGKCWRHDGPDDPLVQQKEVKQWFFKITDYADELLDAIDDLDWTESVKLAQKNWIGRSEGIVYKNKVRDTELEIESFSAHFEAFTANTFVAIAPDHPLLESLVEGLDNKDETLSAAQKMANKRSLEGPKALGEMEGIFTGRYAIDSFGDEDLPIWITSYAIADYGTGIVLCSAHDERDFEFAQKYGIRLKPTMVPADAGEAEKVRNLEYCFTDMENGLLIEPQEFAGENAAGSRQRIADHLVSLGVAYKKVNYKMRDWSVSRQRYWGAPIPIIHCEKCGNVLVPDEQLPVVLPELDDFQPSGDGRSALGRATEWLNVECPTCGGPAERETDTLDTYICSSWYMFRYLDPRNEAKIFDSEIVNKWAPVDFYNGGDHATAHLLYARFVTRFFTKLGIMENPEPFKQMLFNGKVSASDGSPFSKSKGNGVDPLEIINSGYGADALRTYLMFAAPLEFGARWDPQGVPGAYRFLNRLWTLVQEYNAAPAGDVSADAARAVRQATHRMIYKVTLDIEENRYNTAISAAMTAVNDLFKLKVDNLAKHDVWQEALEALVCCVAPFAPYLAEELWHNLGHDDSVHVDHWPIFDESFLVTDTITLVVQVNGKLRSQIQVAADADQETIIQAAQADQKAAAHLDGKEIKKTIVVPGKLVNFVVI